MHLLTFQNLGSLRSSQSNRPNVRRNHSLSPRKTLPASTYQLRYSSRKSDFLASSKYPDFSVKMKVSGRIRYTDNDDYAILDYIITHDLLEQVRESGTWVALESAGVTRHPASSMRCRFLKSIIYHFHSVLQCTPEGRLKYSDPNVAKKLHLRCLEASHSPKVHPSNASSNVTSDNSLHDIITVDSQLLPRLVPYDDTQSDSGPQGRSGLGDAVITPHKYGRSSSCRRLCLSSPSSRRKSLRPRHLIFRRQEDADTIDNVDSQVIAIDAPPQACQITSSSRSSSQTLLKSSSGANGLQDKPVSEELDSTFAPKRRRKCQMTTVDLDVSEVSHNSSSFTAGTQEQSPLSQRVASDIRLPLLEVRPTAPTEVILSRTVAYTRQLDSFARQHQLKAADAALLLHATSGSFEAASRYLETQEQPIWLPSDDSRLLSTSVADVQAIVSKFGSAEVSRRLVYLADRELFI